MSIKATLHKRGNDGIGGKIFLLLDQTPETEYRGITHHTQVRRETLSTKYLLSLVVTTVSLRTHFRRTAISPFKFFTEDTVYLSPS